ncbi:MAG: S8 family serine peptidase [Nonlabens sp.]
MKNLLFLFFCVLVYSSMYSQKNLYGENYFYNGDFKVEVTYSEDSFITYTEVSDEVKSYFEVAKTSPRGFTILDQLTNRLFDPYSVENILPAALYEGSKFKMFLTNTVRVKLKDEIDYNDLNGIISNYAVESVSDRFGIFRIKLVNHSKVLELSNLLMSSGLCDIAKPDYYADIRPTQTDPLYNEQFQLHNTGQVIDGVAGTVNIDCNAPESWDITLGSSSIKVAVLDQGIDPHDDLGARLVGGFTPSNNGDGSQELSHENHGVSCAGIIAASHNNKDVRGIAPLVELLSVKNLGLTSSAGDSEDAIYWAALNSADILNNSWGFRNTPCNFFDAGIDAAIQFAVTSGRNGKGCILIASAGNENTCVRYPASNSNVISVGAVDLKGNRSWYSCFGSNLDVVAPSSGDNRNVRTLNTFGGHFGTLGQNINREDFRTDFSGTSAAAPVVSGVAALILSVRPELTHQEVRSVLTSTARDLGNLGFDTNFGHGLVNGKAALDKALKSRYVVGPEDFCTSTAVTYNFIGPLNSGDVITWEYPVSNMYIMSGQGTASCTLNAFSPGENKFITAVVTSASGEIIKYSRPIDIEHSSSPSKPNISLSQYNPFQLLCCGQSYDFQHAVCNYNCDDLEWDFDVHYQHPNDQYAFSTTGSIGRIWATKNTTSPLIVTAKSRSVNDCGRTSAWSNPIARYYGTIMGSQRSANFRQIEDLAYISVNRKQKSVVVDINDLLSWLDHNYSGKQLKPEEVSKISGMLESKEQFEFYQVNLYDMVGRIQYSKTFKTEEQTNVVIPINSNVKRYVAEVVYGTTRKATTVIF